MERIECTNEADEQRQDAEVVRLWPIRVLILSPDHCFRAAAATLIGRRGCDVLTAEGEQEAVELAAGERIDVLLLERPADEGRRSWEVPVRSVASAVDLALARRGEGVPPVGIVVVSAGQEGEEHPGSAPESLELHKWGPFEELFAAIVRADRHRRLPRERRFLPWPASLRRSGTD